MNYLLITAARNEEAYIRKTLESVIGQTRLPAIWLIVSDGSTDRTDEFVQEFGSRYDFIRLLRLENGAERSFSSKSFAAADFRLPTLSSFFRVSAPYP